MPRVRRRAHEGGQTDVPTPTVRGGGGELATPPRRPATTDPSAPEAPWWGFARLSSLAPGGSPRARQPKGVRVRPMGHLEGSCA